jgi:D-aspartate ligase
MHKWLKAAHVDTPDQLLACYGQMREAGVELLVQERIEGAESRLYAVYLYLDRASDPIASFVMQKQRQWPPGYGNGSYSIGCRRDDVVDLSVKLLKALGYRGIANVEFKQDPKDGQLKLIEVNVRAGNRIALAIDSGVDLPYIAYRDALGEPVAPVDTYEVGVAWIDLLRDAAGISYYRKTEGLSVRKWTSSAWRARSHPYFAADDPFPFVAHTYRIARDALSSAFQRSA